MKIVNAEGENLYIFWTNSEQISSMKLSGKMRLMIILKFTKKQGFVLSLEYTLSLEKTGALKS